MASSQKKTTMNKLNRERKLRERRIDKQAKKLARANAPAETETQPGDELENEVDVQPGDEPQSEIDVQPGDEPQNEIGEAASAPAPSSSIH